MAKGTRICKVCGAEYEYCHTIRKSNVFRYQDVACCPEHGEIYLKRVMEARGKIAKPEEPVKTPEPIAESVQEEVVVEPGQEKDTQPKPRKKNRKRNQAKVETETPEN